MNSNQPHLTPSDIVLKNMHDHMPTIGAIDLGTNSCRLLVASINVISLHRNFFKLRGESDLSMKIIDSYTKVVGLGEGIRQTGSLSKNAMERTLEALTICKKKLTTHHVSVVRSVATEACRQAENAYILVEKVRNELGIDLEIITPKEEAQLVLHGCLGVVSEHKPYGIVIDIGGGSTEVIWLRVLKNNNRITLSVIDSMSLPYGVVTLRDTYIHLGKDPKFFQTVQQGITQAMQFFMEKNNITESLNKKLGQVIASSGTATTLGAIALDLKEYNRFQIDARDFKSTRLQEVGNKLLGKYLAYNPGDVLLDYGTETLLTRVKEVTPAEQSSLNHESFVYSRVGLLASGTVILDSIFDAMGPQVIKVADRGVREGILYDLVEQLRNEQSNCMIS